MLFRVIFRFSLGKFNRRDFVGFQQFLQRSAVLFFLVDQLHDAADQYPGQRMSVARGKVPCPYIWKKFVVDIIHSRFYNE